MIGPIFYSYSQQHIAESNFSMIIHENEIPPDIRNWTNCIDKRTLTSLEEEEELNHRLGVRVYDLNELDEKERTYRIEERIATECCAKKISFKKTLERTFHLWDLSIADIKEKANQLYKNAHTLFGYCDQTPNHSLIKDIESFKRSLNQTILNKQVKNFFRDLSSHPLQNGEFLVTQSLPPILSEKLSKEANRTQWGTANVIKGILCFKEIKLLQQKNQNYLNFFKQLEYHLSKSKSKFNALEIEFSTTCQKSNAIEQLRNQSNSTAFEFSLCLTNIKNLNQPLNTTTATDLLKVCNSEIKDLETELELANMTLDLLNNEKHKLKTIISNTYQPMYNEFKKNYQEFYGINENLDQCTKKRQSNAQSLKNHPFDFDEIRQFMLKLYRLEVNSNACEKKRNDIQRNFKKKEKMLNFFLRKLKTIAS